MDEERKMTEREAHRHFGAALFNHTWSLLDKPERSREEADETLHAAHASRYRWGVARGWSAGHRYTARRHHDPRAILADHRV
jgi:hypothetical protein